MPTLKIWTEKRGREWVLTDRRDEGENVRLWELQCRDVTVQDEILAASYAVQQGLFSTSGGADRRAVLLAKGLIFGQRVITGWNRKDDTQGDLPVTEGTVASLPRAVLIEIGAACLGGLPDDEAIEAGKKQPA